MRSPERPRHPGGSSAPTCVALLAALLTAAPAQALDYQVHGFLAQGFVLSEGNDFYGGSHDGTLNFFEAGLNGSMRPIPKLLLSGQVLARDAGATDSGELRLDYAFADYQAWAEPEGVAGLRLGRVKNPYGLFNDSRDVVFTRPGILLPLSVYFEGQGARTLLFSSDGAQAYGGLTFGGHYLSVVGGLSPSKTLSNDDQEQLFGALADQGDVSLHEFGSLRLMDEWGDGRWAAAASYLHGNLRFEPNPGVPLSGQATFDLYLVSLRYNGERYSLTGEYGVTASESEFNSFGTVSRSTNTSDSLYVQAEYFLNPQWTLMGRYEAAFADSDDRDGSECLDENQMPGNSHGCYAHDLGAGLSWKPDKHWGLWAEYHYIHGSYTASRQDNSGGLDPHWSMLLLMAAYHF
ncbi:MAG: hypothetical protein Q8Q73_18155 [Stagnimonas sp.]|nr:hypothetical protein [Stagnimonas sp.]